MKEENTNIEMKLDSVNEVKFIMLPDKISNETDFEEIKLGFSNQIIPDIENDAIAILFGVRYAYKNEIVLESIYRFTFSVVGLKKYITLNDNIITIAHLMPHFISVAVGTMRGILVVKTAGTNLSKTPLPMIDPNQLNVSLSADSKE